MRRSRDRRLRAVATLLQNVRNRRVLARNEFARETLRGVAAAALPGIVDGLLDELSGESEQQRRQLTVLRRSDIGREPHAAVARDVGLSRSQFYRDLRQAREIVAHALEDRFGAPAGEGPAADTRFVAIDALRAGGQFERARAMAGALARAGGAVDAIRALCTCAELEIQSGAFAEAHDSVRKARALLDGVAPDRLRDLLSASCDLAEFEAAHCQGKPVEAARRCAALEGLRERYQRYGRHDATPLVKALVAESSLCFAQGDARGARAAIDEARAVVANAHLAGSKPAVDVAIRASGIASLQADRVGEALEQSASIVRDGARAGDVHALRVGMQMMSAHLLTLGRLDEARHYALEAWALIDLFGSALDRAIVLSNLARIDIHRRDGAEALRWIRLAREVPCDAFPITQALAISHAEALVLVDRAARAVELARAAGARVAAWPRLLGRSKLAEATALCALERSAEARRCSFQAVELSHGSGGPLLELRALDLNVRLTGSATSLHALRELQAALSG